MSLLKKLAGETAIYGMSSILSRLLNYVILTPYFTRVFLAEEYGVVSLLFTYTAILLVLFTYRMETAFFRFGSKAGQLEQAFSTSILSLLATTAIFAGGLFVLQHSIAEFLHFEAHPEYIRYIILIIAFDTLVAIPFARLRLANRPIRFAIIKTLHILLNMAFIFLFLEGFPALIDAGFGGVESMYDRDNKVAYVFIANLLASFIVLLLLLPYYFQIKLRFDWELWRRMIRYTMPLVVVGLAAVINQLIALPLLENLLPGTVEENRAAVGSYSAASKLAVLMSLFIQAFNYAAEPFFFNQSEREDSKEIYAQVGQAFALVGSLVFLGILLYLDLVKLIIGKDTRGAIEVVPILLMAYYFLGWYYNFSIWYKLTDRTHYGAYISLAGVVVTLLLNFTLVSNPQIGYLGAAYAALACYALMAALSYWTGRRHYDVPYPIFRMLGYMGLAVGIYGLSLLIEQFTAGWSLALRLLVNTFLLGAFLTILFFTERKSVQEMLRRV